MAADRAPPPNLAGRLTLFAAAFALVIGLVVWAGGEHAHAARHFLRELLRRVL